MQAHEIYAKWRPRIGDAVTYGGSVVGTVTHIEGALCWHTYPDREPLPFIWCFRDGLNSLHDWPATQQDAAAPRAFCPPV